MYMHICPDKCIHTKKTRIEPSLVDWQATAWWNSFTQAKLEDREAAKLALEKAWMEVGMTLDEFKWDMGLY